MKKISPLVIEKFDITHKILKELSNLESRNILFSVINVPKNVCEIASETGIPVSSVYNKIKSLKKNALISEKLILTKHGRRTKLYQSRIADVKISISKFEPKITFIKNLRNQYE